MSFRKLGFRPSLLLGRFLLGAAAAGSTAACSEPKAAEPRELERRQLPLREVFIAMERDFQSFRSWGSVEIEIEEAQGITHLLGPRRIYANALPPAAATEFPVGTILVKEGATEEGGPLRLLAMVKRGGGFKERADASVGISWRGLGAPDGESYGGDPLGTCNSCHRRDKKNDFIRSDALELSPDES